jgi:hypothetical protein
MLAFTSVYFSESGLFNGLRAIQIKNYARSTPVVFRSSSRSITLHAAAQRSWSVDNQEESNTHCGFSQTKAGPHGYLGSDAARAAARVALQEATEARSRRLDLSAASLFQSA